MHTYLIIALVVAVAIIAAILIWYFVINKKTSVFNPNSVELFRFVGSSVEFAPSSDTTKNGDVIWKSTDQSQFAYKEPKAWEITGMQYLSYIIDEGGSGGIKLGTGDTPFPFMADWNGVPVEVKLAKSKVFVPLAQLLAPNVSVGTDGGPSSS